MGGGTFLQGWFPCLGTCSACLGQDWSQPLSSDLSWLWSRVCTVEVVIAFAW